MSYIALYRKWRPLVFEDVVEQEHVVRTLKNAVSSGRIAHAYLFCGTRGTGKTTMAKIFSRAINCLNPREGDPCNECEVCRGILSQSILDVVEIDAASNNSVDNVREIRDEVIYAPSQAKYKVYIIDEVHMLSTGAFNALLKTLEEPPEHVVFVLATTEPHKLPATILSRCQRFDFRRITVESIVGRLSRIAQESGVSIQKEAGRLIAKMSDGALRDAISILDQCISMGNKEISYDDVLTVVGIVNDTFISGIVDALLDRNMNRMLEQVEQLVMDGKDIAKFVSDLVFYFRNLLICKMTGNPAEIIEASREMLDTMGEQCKRLSQDEIIYIIKEMSALESTLKWTTHPRIMLEVSLIKICQNYFALENGDVLNRLADLERRVNSGEITAKAAVKAEKSLVDSGVEKVRKPGRKNTEEGSGSVKVAVNPGNELQCWGNVLNDLMRSGRVAIYSNLLGTKAVQLDDKFIGVIFEGSGGFKKMFVSKTENLEALEATVSRILGRDVRVKCLDEDSFRDSQKLEPREERDEFLQKAEDLANRLNVPLNIIDE